MSLRMKCLGLLAGLTLSVSALALTGKVLDAQSGKPIAGAMVTVEKRVVQTNPEGVFKIDAAAPIGISLGARAVGYGRTSIPLPVSEAQPFVIRLAPMRPKALY